MAILTFLGALIKPVSTILKDWFNNARETRQARHSTSLALEVNKQRIIETKLSNEHSLNSMRLQSTGKYFKYFTFIMWFSPFILSWVFPEFAQQIFENMEGLPAWYVESCITIMFTVWSIAVSRETVQTIFHNLGRYMKSKREFKLQRKVVYDMLKIGVKRPLSQEEVDTLNPILNYIEKEANK